jgi:ADP-heptose:LPS heptosyltransferase
MAGMADSSPSVVLIRLDAIGDALALTPLLHALSGAAIPVDIVLSPRNAGIFSARAARAVIVANVDDGANLAGRGYTHALVATEDAAGYRMARASGARQRIGFVNGWGKPLKTLWARSLLTRALYRSAGLDPRAPHECEVLFALGTTLPSSGSAPPRQSARLRPFVLDEEPAGDSRVAVQITGKWQRLGMAWSDVMDLVRRLRSRSDVRLVASQKESAVADRAAKDLGTSVERFGALAPWKAAIGAARALIAPDSGAVHVAGMVGTPTVAIFPPQPQFELQVARWRPWAAPYRIVRADPGWTARATDALDELTATGEPESRQPGMR